MASRGIARSIERLSKLLHDYGASQFLYREDYDQDRGNLIVVEFLYKEYPVSFSISVESLAAKKMEKDPWTTRKRCTEVEWIARALNESRVQAAKMLLDYVTTMVSYTQWGVVDFEQLFLPHFKLKNGRTVGQELLPALGDILNTGELPLLSGIKNV